MGVKSQIFLVRSQKLKVKVMNLSMGVKSQESKVMNLKWELKVKSQKSWRRLRDFWLRLRLPIPESPNTAIPMGYKYHIIYIIL